MLELFGLASWQQAGLFAFAVLLLNATPGVDLLLTVARTLTGGARAGLAAAAGIELGCVVHALAAAFGLAALLAVNPAAFMVLKWAGAAYLVWLALGMARNAWRPATAGDTGSPPPRRSLADEVRTGFLTNVLNPKVALFFLAFIPQFITPAAQDKTLAFLLLGAWFVLQSTLFLALLVAVAARARRLQTRPAVGRALNAAGAGLFGALAFRVVNS
ncbi:LysE family translocator [Rubrivivax albus]|uniref:LysE family translocator n=1 Tax=Rubrivivax albus TaxID=2499835 RepID=A0A437JX95_9BURK|nr:LysE family translocator [Rubrivivax albus]RVT52303.1 LysE family translocator [Rubrivivax albus]